MGIYGTFDDDDDLNGEKIKFFLLVAGIVLFVVATVVSWRELRYLVSSQVTNGTVTDVRVETRRQYRRYGPDRVYRQRVATYTFDDAGTPQDEDVDVAMSWPHKVGDTLRVQFIPGDRTYIRLYGTWQWWWLLLFVGTSGVMIYATMRLVREARAFAREQAAYDADLAAHRGETVSKPSKRRY